MTDARPERRVRTDVDVVILAAGIGTRLGRPHPKPLTRLADGRTILQQQIDNVRSALGDARITIVVGFKLDLILEAAPDCLFVYNENFDRSNTSKSLAKALRLSGPGGVLWLNGDVVFDGSILERVLPHIDDGQSLVCVNTASVGDEEVTYTLGEEGFVARLAKGLGDGLGEAVGINFVAAADREALVRRLDECDDQDYFEHGIEQAVALDGIRVLPLDISDLFAVEVDFEEDLLRANAERHE